MCHDIHKDTKDTTLWWGPLVLVLGGELSNKSDYNEVDVHAGTFSNVQKC